MTYAQARDRAIERASVARLEAMTKGQLTFMADTAVTYDAAITALAEAGFVVVPKVSSEDMKTLGARSLRDTVSQPNQIARAEDVYRAMVEAGKVG